MSQQLEIERRFLVDRTWLNDLTFSDRLRIKQHYIQDDNQAVTRVRESYQIDHRNKRISCSTYTLTTKLFVDQMTSEEDERVISENLFFKLKATEIYSAVDKIRHIYFDRDNKKWEIDDFSGVIRSAIGFNSLIAEIELRSPDDQVIIPSWFGQEITGNKLYSNVSIAARLYFLLNLKHLAYKLPNNLQDQLIKKKIINDSFAQLMPNPNIFTFE